MLAVKREALKRMKIRRCDGIDDEIKDILERATPEDWHEQSHPSIQGDGNIVNSGTIVVHNHAEARRQPNVSRPQRELAKLLIQAIREHAITLALTETQVLEIASKELRQKLIVLSLDNLTERELGHVYQALLKTKRPGLR